MLLRRCKLIRRNYRNYKNEKIKEKIKQPENKIENNIKL